MIVSGRDLAGRVALSDFDLDLEFGDGAKNDFELTCAEQLSIGEYVGIEGTEYGGVVDAIEETTKSAETVYSGRSWQGILAAKVLCPDSGADYLTVSGDANTVLASLVSRVGLTALFAVDGGGSGIYVDSYSFDRYTDCYTGMRKMLAKSGAKLMVAYQQGAVRMWAAAVDTIDGAVDSDVMDFDATTVGRQVNHLIGLGKGELRDRAVVHRYADVSGNVSSTQTYTGVDEYAAVYDYSSVEADKLAEETEKKLKDLHTSGKVEFSIGYAGNAHVGDVITARNNRTGRTVTAPIAKKIVKVSGGVLTVEYDVGEQSTTSTSLSGHGETASGTVYTAGDGIKIASGRISAEVTQKKLDAVDKTAQKGVDDASSASSAAGTAQAKADSVSKSLGDYKTSNDAAVKAVKATADAAVSGVSATSPISATRSGNSVSLSHAASGVSAGAYGPAADATPTWGESVTVGARLAVDKEGHVTSAAGRSVRLPSSTATSSAAGLMAAADKAKLDGIASGAQVNSVSSVNGKTGAVSLGADDVGAATASHSHDTMKFITGRPATADFATKGRALVHVMMSTVSMKTGRPSSDGYIVNLEWDNNWWATQIFIPDIESHPIQIRSRTPSSSAADGYAWSVWKSLCYVADLKNASVKAATTATKLSTARTIKLTGAVTGSAKFDGSGDVTIATVGQSAAAQFLAAYPVGSYFFTSDAGFNPATYGGTWERVVAVGMPITWHRTA